MVDSLEYSPATEAQAPLSHWCDTLFSQGQTACVILSPDLRCSYSSPNHQPITGWTTQELTAEGWLSRIHPEDRDTLLQLLQLSMLKDHGHANFCCDYRLLHSDDQWHWYRADIQNSENFRCFDPRFFNGLMILSHDVGEFKYQQQRLKEIRIVDDAQEACRQALIGHISHNLRTPLNAIVGFAELLAAHINPEQYHVYLGHILGSGRQMLQTIETLLTSNGEHVYDTRLDEGTFDSRTLLQAITLPCKTTSTSRITLSLPRHAIWAYIDGAKITRALEDVLAYLDSRVNRANTRYFIAAHLTSLGELRIEISLPKEISLESMQTLVAMDAQAFIHIASENAQATLGLTLAVQLLRLHQARLELASYPNGHQLHIVLPASRILSSQSGL
jgi:hypothetical protein